MRLVLSRPQLRFDEISGGPPVFSGVIGSFRWVRRNARRSDPN
jgi:hypothetical protein